MAPVSGVGLKGQRAGLLAKVHVAKADQAMAEHSYRSLLRRVGGADSAADLDVRALERVVEEFARLGWRPKRGRPPSAPSGAPAQRRKIAALLAGMELPEAYAEGILKRMFGERARLGMASPRQLRAVTAALVNRRRREAAE